MKTLQIQPGALRELVATLSEHYPILSGELPVTLESGAPAGTLEVSRTDNGAIIRYDRPSQACRGIGTLLSGIDECREQTSFTTLGIMLDCSRNAVMTVEHFKGWLRQLALLGYNMAMLYTEDTYELPGEDFFGYKRGRYSAEELKEIDDYASRLGIEMIGCIQTLGHLERVLHLHSYCDMKDTNAVMMVDDERTYELIEKMIVLFARTYQSRRIHIGMDETHDLGRGRFMDLHGYQRGYDLFIRHLERVSAICTKHGLQPMLWSDMFFRMGSPTQAYDTTCQVPEDVKHQIPRAAQLVFWDYYQTDKNYYAEMIRKHRELGVEPLMASGVWTWTRLWYDRAITEANMLPCIAACRETGVKELFFTMWGDGGAFCEQDSALAGLALAAEHAYGGAQADAQVGERFNAICGANYDAVLLAATELNASPHPIPLLWDDPLLRIGWHAEQLNNPGNWLNAARRYARITRRLRPLRDVTEPVDIAHVLTLMAFLRKKIELNTQLDAGAFDQIKIKPVVRALDQLLASFRRQWFRRNKPQGFEPIQVKLGGQKQRYAELALRLEELAAGKITNIPELDEHPATPMPTPWGWNDLTTAGNL